MNIAVNLELMSRVSNAIIHSILCYRYDALDTTIMLLPSLVETLELISEDQNYRTDWDMAGSLLRSITAFSFIYTLYISCQVMSCTKELCVKLQGILLYLLWA